jgi:hypothetical protein
MTSLARAGARADRPRIGLYRRVSTRHQLDNERYADAFRAMSDVIDRYDGDAVEYDEGGHARSGGMIRGRKVFEQMLADVASGDLDGIAAPDVRSLSRGAWMIDGKTIAETLIHANAILITRDMRYDLRRSGDLRAFQDRLYWAMQERAEVTRRFYEGQAARARNVVEGSDGPWGRHRTMIGHHLVILTDDAGRPRQTRRGQLKRAWARDPDQARDMDALIRAFDAQPNRGALFAALYQQGVRGPEPSAPGGWSKRSLRTLLRSPFHQGRWPLVRTPKSTIWYGLDPRLDPSEFDATRVTRDCPELAYWTPSQARAWERKFVDAEDRTRRSPASKKAFAHPLLGLLRCPRCHRALLGKGAEGYICPSSAKGTRAVESCLPIFTMRESSAQGALRSLIPLLIPRLEELRASARASLKRRNEGGLDIRLQVLDNEERAILAQLQALVAAGVSAPASFTDRLIEIAGERQRTLHEQQQGEQVAQHRLEAERVLARLDPGQALEILGEMEPAALAEVYRAFFEWVEAKPNGRGRVGGELLDYMFHNPQTSGHLQVVEQLGALFTSVA